MIEDIKTICDACIHAKVCMWKVVAKDLTFKMDDTTLLIRCTEHDLGH